MKVVTIHQPEHLPWLGFFHKASQADALVLLDTVQFRKNYFGHRNRLLGPQGPFWVTVPVHHKGHATYGAVEIAEDGRWRPRYLKSVQYHYGRHPHFASGLAVVAEALQADHHLLGTLNEHLIRRMLASLGIDVEVVRASTLGASGVSSALLLDLCQRMGADVYLSGRMGREYLDESIFRASGIEVRYQAFQHPVYPQWGGRDFVSGLSALDLLMNCGGGGGDVVRAATLQAGDAHG